MGSDANIKNLVLMTINQFSYLLANSGLLSTADIYDDMILLICHILMTVILGL